MKERWITPAPEAQERQEEKFRTWLSADGICFENPEGEASYKERINLIKDAIQLQRTPSRIPISPSTGHFPIEYAGITWREAMYDYGKLSRAWEKYHQDFAPDFYHSPRTVVPGKVLDILDFKLYRWAGNSLRDDQEYQFVEGEYMKAEEYQDLIDDPTGYFLNVYFPRIFGELKALEKMPIMPAVHEIPLVPPAVIPFGTKEVRSAFRKLAQAGEKANEWNTMMAHVSGSIMGKGFPAFSAGFSKAPFDVIGDSLRGTLGVLTDMFRHPDELKEACERIVPFMVKLGAAACKAAGHIMVFMPLHKGADGFMSDEQFRTFYWPTLRKVIIGLIDEGIVPQLFAEGGYDSRLDIISDLPEGRTVWWFDTVDMARAKETVGKVSCIAGNVPLSLLCTGTPDDVTNYCRKLMKTAGKDGGFIFSTGAGMQGAKPANVQAMIKAAKGFGSSG